MIGYIMLAVIGCFIVILLVSFVFFVLEFIKSLRNPVPLQINHDKRFGEINSVYSHKVFEIKRGKEWSEVITMIFMKKW